jgi:uncharacterized protein YcfJ
MNKRIVLQHSLRGTLALAAICTAATVALADNPASTAPNTSVTKETREKMALLHEQMAACLRSDKPIADCHAQMRKSCQESLGAHRCPMMDGGNTHRKMGAHND